MRLNAVLGILDFFIPASVLSSVLLVFTMENILDHLFQVYVPENAGALGWVLVYILGITAISAMNYATADEEELEDLSDDLEDL
jgi:hypothetical protein